jgi:VanZ family protein
MHKQWDETAINNHWIRGGCILAAFFMAVTLFIGAETVATAPMFPPPLDKLSHFTYYGIMAALLAHGVGLPWLIVPLILVPVIGAGDEWHQSFIPGRDASLWDWLADEAGTVVAVFLYWTWRTRAGAREKDRG